VAGSPTSFRVEALAENDWVRLRDIRLTALKADPTAFLSSHQTEAAFAEQQWREQFSRGEWHVMRAGAVDVGLVGVTREPDMPARECYLEYLWVAQAFRGRGVATLLLRAVLDRLHDSGVQIVWLYILDGNDPAMRLYQGFGFQSTNERQPLPGDSTRSEERMRLRLN
jgi:ribosomal protein S18 acetylase RimI-like enzyme